MDYIPKRDEQARTWFETFASVITANSAVYQLTSADATAIQNAVDAFVAALIDSKEPSTRTPLTIGFKVEARVSAEQICRQYAQIIRMNAGISNQDKEALGLRPINPSRTPVPVPASSPALMIIGATPGSHTLRYTDSMSPDGRSKPFGASQILLYRAVADTPITDPEQAVFAGYYTRNPIGVGFSPAQNAKIATYFARWGSRRGQVGPWSLPISMAIAA